MGKKRSRRRQSDYAMLTVSVSASSAYISHRILNPKYDDGNRPASSHITIEGALNEPVIHRQSALVHVHCRDQGDPGAALGVNKTHLQVLVYLPRAQFADLMALVAAQRLAHVDLLTDALRHGNGRDRSAGFHTARVPAETEEVEVAPNGPA
jgi:hypothetical protein